MHKPSVKKRDAVGNDVNPKSQNKSQPRIKYKEYRNLVKSGRYAVGDPKWVGLGWV